MAEAQAQHIDNFLNNLAAKLSQLAVSYRDSTTALGKKRVLQCLGQNNMFELARNALVHRIKHLSLQLSREIELETTPVTITANESTKDGGSLFKIKGLKYYYRNFAIIWASRVNNMIYWRFQPQLDRHRCKILSL